MAKRKDGSKALSKNEPRRKQNPNHNNNNLKQQQQY
jgi:hypothetical protein